MQTTGARIHRFHDLVGISFDGTEQLYLSHRTAEALGQLLIDYAEDVRERKFSNSDLETATLEAGE